MLRIKDLHNSLNFYKDILGLKEISRRSNGAERYTLVFLATPEDSQQETYPMIELTYNWDSETYSSGRNFGHIAFEVDNIYEFCGGLMRQGIEINRPPRDGAMSFIKSPDNISIELLQKGEPLEIQLPWCDMNNSGTW
jgi:lactoylglutathione lyase